MVELLIKVTNRLKRIFYAWWNLMRFRSYGRQIQHQGNVQPKLLGPLMINIRKNGVLCYGDHLLIKSADFHNPLGTNIKAGIFIGENACLTIGNHVGISCSSIRVHKSIFIGNYVSIGANCIIMDSDGHSLDYNIRRDKAIDQQKKCNAPIVIEDDVLIGTRCIILKGVTIGARSVIGAGSVVVKDIPSDCIAAGNPCRVIKFFNSND